MKRSAETRRKISEGQKASWAKRVRETVPSQATIERFWSKVDKSQDCWLWQGGRIPKGYGWFYFRKTWFAHRFSMFLVGKLIDDLSVDHLCRNKACVNPDHMEMVTLKENALRGQGLGEIK